MYSEMCSGPLPLLRTLIVNPDEWSRFNTVTPPLLPFFGGAFNLKQLVFNSKKLNFLNHFVLPNLTIFELSTWQASTSNISDLFSFLKASPKLRTVQMKISGRIALGGVPQEIVAILPNVETISLSVGYGSGVYEVATRISCPCAKNISLIHYESDDNYTPDLGIFPSPALWSAISSQYARNPVEEVTLEIEPGRYGGTVECFLISRSSDTTTVRLCFRVDESGEDGIHTPFDAMGWELFSRACSAIQDHPSLADIKRLHIKYRAAISYVDQAIPISNEVGELFNSMGPLDELTIHGCDLNVFLGSFLDLMDPDEFEPPDPFPYIKELTISHPLMEINEEECLGAIVDLAESQHERGIPFERVTVRAAWLPTAMAERLREWVDVVECYEEEYKEG